MVWGDVRPVLMIDPMGFGSCLEQSKSRERPCHPSGRALGSLFPYQGAGAWLASWHRDIVPLFPPRATDVSCPWLKPPVSAASEGGSCFPLRFHEHGMLGCPRAWA